MSATRRLLRSHLHFIMSAFMNRLFESFCAVQKVKKNKRFSFAICDGKLPKMPIVTAVIHIFSSLTESAKIRTR